MHLEARRSAAHPHPAAEMKVALQLRANLKSSAEGNPYRGVGQIIMAYGLPAVLMTFPQAPSVMLTPAM